MATTQVQAQTPLTQEQGATSDSSAPSASVCYSPEDVDSEKVNERKSCNSIEVVPMSALLQHTKRQCKKLVYSTLVQRMDEIRQKKFAETDESIQKMNIPAKEKKKIRKTFGKIDSKIQKGKDRDRLEAMLLFYPEIKEQLVKENPEYEKYFCYFNDQSLRKKKLQHWDSYFSSLLSTTAYAGTALGALGIKFNEILKIVHYDCSNCKELSKITSFFSVLNLALGAKDLATAISQREQVVQKRIAKSFLKISEEAEKIIKSGKETDPETRKALQGLVLDSEKKIMLQKEIDEGRAIQWKGVLGGVQMANGMAFVLAGFAEEILKKSTSLNNLNNSIFQVGSDGDSSNDNDGKPAVIFGL